jgi:hypothetical protein
MGGEGSGNWLQSGKFTVEDCRSLEIGGFRGRIFPHSSGVVTWTRDGVVTSSVSYVVTWNPMPTLTLHYRQGKIDTQEPIPLEATCPYFGGRRWWFLCPSCSRRVGKLFLSRGAKYFGCRHCHNLTHRSAQEAHTWERVAVRLGFDADVGKSLNSRLRGKRVK